MTGVVAARIAKHRVFFLITALLSFRSAERIYHADIWGEDSLFLTDALQRGVNSLFIPFAGVFHTIPRLIAIWVESIVPLSLWPLAIALLSILLFAFVLSRFADREFEWLVASSKIRFVVCIAAALTPGMNEMVGNLANLNWPLVFWVALLLLRPLTRALDPWEVAAACLVVVSVGTSFTLLPLIGWRLWQAREALSRYRYEGFLAVFIVGYLVFLFLARPHLTVWGDVYFPPDGNLAPVASDWLNLAPMAYAKSVARSAVYRMWLGNGLSSLLADRVAFGNTLAVLATLALAAFSLFSARKIRWLAAPAILLFGVSLWPIPAWLARPGSLSTFLLGEYWHYRYSFPLGFAALLFWAAQISARPRWQKLMTIFLVLSILHGLDRFFIRAYRLNYPQVKGSWGERAEPLRAWLEDPEVSVSVPTFPAGWSITVLGSDS